MYGTRLRFAIVVRKGVVYNCRSNIMAGKQEKARQEIVRSSKSKYST